MPRRAAVAAGMSVAAGLSVVPLLATLLAAPAALAANTPSTTRVTSTKLKAEGVRLRVGLSATCPTGASLHVSVTVTEANGTRIAQGTGTQDADCTGTAQDLIVRVKADPAGALFVKGPATARTVRTVCDDTGCSVIPFDETIKVTD